MWQAMSSRLHELSTPNDPYTLPPPHVSHPLLPLLPLTIWDPHVRVIFNLPPNTSQPPRCMAELLELAGTGAPDTVSESEGMG